MCFLTGEFSLLMCSLTRSWMKRVVLPMYCWPQLLHVSLYTAFLRRHNPELEIGHLSLVHLRSVEVWDRACLRVWDLWAIRTGMFSFLKMLVIL